MNSSNRVFDLLYSGLDKGHGRFTQDSPILPDVWIAFAQPGVERIELLLTPHNRFNSVDLANLLRSRMRESCQILANESHVLVEASLGETVALLQQTSWLNRSEISDSGYSTMANAFKLASKELTKSALTNDEAIEQSMRDLESKARDATAADNAQLLRIARLLVLAAKIRLISLSTTDDGNDAKQLKGMLAQLRESADLSRWRKSGITGPEPLIWSISTNRRGVLALTQSRSTIKADAAARVFDVTASGICWAIVDSGVDASHPALTREKELTSSRCDPRKSRVTSTLDFTRLRRLWGSKLTEVDLKSIAAFTGKSHEEVRRAGAEIRSALYSGRTIDWADWTQYLAISHDPALYSPPKNPHGTHVAGILGACWRSDRYPAGTAAPADLDEGSIIGICPDIDIIDVRVFDDTDTDEFSLIAALQYLRWLNQSKSKRVVHGANLSFSLAHDVRNFACGRTPICEESERLWNSGVVVVAAAGNNGFERSADGYALDSAYRTVTVTDPGNAARVITVGSTHRTMPHTYGVSYFSSRGPTGDGRYKPDLVAPGEKIRSLGLNGESLIQDGTSMAAPHVSGTAAMLLARHSELIGKPDRVKEILCKTATDLGRDRYFQGAGLVDTLRALQSV